MAQTQKKVESALPQAGDKAPDFTLPDDQGRPISLKDFRGKKLVVYFYPKDDTPGCTTEGKDFRDHYEKFQDCNTEIFGISKCSVKSHDKFKCKYEFPFSLLSDESGDVCERYGVWVEKNMYGKTYMGIQRATFLIDETGVVRHVWPKVKVEGHALEVLAQAQQLR